MANYAIIGIAKLKTAGNIGGVLEHMTRQRPTANSNGRANDILIPPPTLPELMADINSYLPRKNAVLCYDMLLTASPDYFTGKTEKQIQDWQRASLEWVYKKFGRESVKACICHRDELTPHLSLLVLPDHEGKLNARFYTGGKAKMRQLWTEYGAAMKPLGLERGREYSPAKHQDIKAYYRAVNQGAELAKVREIKAEELPAPELLDMVSPRQYAADLINRVTAIIRRENGSLRAALAEERNQREQTARQMIAERGIFHTLKDNPEAFRELQEALKKELQGRAKDRQQYDRLAMAIKQYFQQNIDPRSTLRHPDKLGALLDFPEIRDSIRISIAPDERERRGMVRERG